MSDPTEAEWLEGNDPMTERERMEGAMTTDNRTNEPTEAQVEAAAKALYEFETGLAEDSWGRAFEVERSLWRDEARAALVAAQGAAPQAESEELAWYKVAAKHSADSMAEARATLQMFADRVDPFVFDELSSVLDDQPLDYETGDVIGEAAPVLPSSTVDEDKLAEVIGGLGWGYMVDGPSAREITRAVVAYLRGES